jgi:hypothetical protein
LKLKSVNIENFKNYTFQEITYTQKIKTWRVNLEISRITLSRNTLCTTDEILIIEIEYGSSIDEKNPIVKYFKINFTNLYKRYKQLYDSFL